jgi:DNA-binding transcriptional regulator YiaG
LDQLKQRIEQSLVELRDARKHFAEALTDYRKGKTGISRKQVKLKKQSFKETRRQAKRMLREWENALHGLKSAA